MRTSRPTRRSRQGRSLKLEYLQAAVVRRINQLPPSDQNGGFGVPETSTHLHNFHSGSDSDGGPCNPTQQRFFFRGQYYDYYYNMRFAGWNSHQQARRRASTRR